MLYREIRNKIGATLDEEVDVAETDVEEVIVEEVVAEEVDVEDAVCRGCGTETIPAEPFLRFSPRKTG